MNRASLAALAGCVLVPAASADGLRVACWNIEFYNGGRGAEIRTAVYGSFNGRSFAPDVFLLQEFDGQAAANTFANELNAAPQSGGDWVAATVYDNGNDNNAVVYRTSRLTLIGSVQVAAGSTSANPRIVGRHDFRLAGYSGEASTISFYPVHYKAGGSSSDANRRNIESGIITANLATLPAGRAAVLAGDFNIPSSSEQSFVTLVGPTSNYNSGPFRDPITVPGSWQNNGTFRFIHTQDPQTQIDDRYDLLLVSPSLVNGSGLDYIGNFSDPWDLSTWNDPDHSYRCWGNDGSSFNQPLTTTGNQNVGFTIAAALSTVSDHLPVYLDLRVPARLAAPFLPLNLGDVPMNAPYQFDLNIGSDGNVALWGAAGIEATRFSFTAGPRITAPSGQFTDAAGGAVPAHTFTLDTSGLPLGAFSTFIDIASNDAILPNRRLIINATITGPAGCSPADFAEDFGALDINDILTFADAFDTQDATADLTGEGDIDINDILTFADLFDAGCP